MSYYEAYWRSGGHQPLRSETPPEIARLYSRMVKPTDACLDLGCGDGGTSGTFLAVHAASYVGVDVSAEAVARACDKGFDAQQIADASALPFSDDTFDVVVCIEVLEHLFEPQLAVIEAGRVLTPGGLLIITVPNGSHWRDRADMLFGLWQPGGDNLGRAQPWRSPHIRFFSMRSLPRLLEQHGFEVVESGGFPAPLLLKIPGLRRFSGQPGMAARIAAKARPSLFSGHLWAVAKSRH